VAARLSDEASAPRAAAPALPLRAEPSPLAAAAAEALVAAPKGGDPAPGEDG
jgi:hypothetical protein